MLPECPDDLRPAVLPFLQRASELRGREPVVAYYCGMYAATLALTRGRTGTPETNAFTKALIESLEAEKHELPADTFADADGPRRAILALAMRIFLAADNDDRAGAADLKTARFFLRAAQFMEVLRVFTNGEPGLPEIEERLRYARWRAAEISRAMSEGRKPDLPPGADASASDAPFRPSSEPPKSPGLPSLSGQYPADGPVPGGFSSPSDAPVASPPAAQSAAARTAQALPSVPHTTPPQSLYDPATLAAAERQARFAVSAILFEDVPTAISSLEEALRILRSL